MSGLPSTTQRLLFLLSISSLLCRLLFRSTITFLMRCATFTVLRLRLIDTMQAINFGIHSSCGGITHSAFTGTMHQTLIAVHAFEICIIFHTHTLKSSCPPPHATQISPTLNTKSKISTYSLTQTKTNTAAKSRHGYKIYCQETEAEIRI
jgi:hypothetical protein